MDDDVVDATLSLDGVVREKIGNYPYNDIVAVAVVGMVVSFGSDR